MNWFQRHLNWIYILGWVLVFFVVIVADRILMFTDTYYTEQISDVINAAVIFVIPLLVSIWVLRRKNRSMWWLLLGGIFAPLWLGNKSELPN